MPGAAESTRLTLGDDELKERFYRLQTSSDVAALLDVSYNRLTFHIWRKSYSSRYKKFSITKRNGGSRSISAPQGGLRIIQQKLAQVLMAVHRPKPSSHGFVRGRSIVTNAAKHIGRRVVLNVDLRDFFPSIHFGRVRGMFVAHPFHLPAEVATLLAQICFAGEPGLPQGAPTSPVVANMIASPMDSRLQRLAELLHCTYSRYADDLTFSTTRRVLPEALLLENGGQLSPGVTLQDAIHASGFSVNLEKLRSQSRYERQEVTGLVVNQRVNVPRRFVRQIRAMVHAWDRYGYAAAQAEFTAAFDTKHRHPKSLPRDYESVLFGKLAYLHMIRGGWDLVYLHLLEKARALRPPQGRRPRFHTLPTGWDAIVVLERDVSAFLRDNRESQGTGFLLDGVGLVTAAHVVHDMNGFPLSSMLAFQHYEHAPQHVLRHEYADIPRDIAVMTNPFRAIRPLVSGDSGLLRPGDEVTVVGFGHWSETSSRQVTRARVTGRLFVDPVHRILIDSPIHTGNSGGPVLNSQHQVVGIAVTGSPYGDYPNGVVPIEEVLALLSQNANTSASVP